MRVLAIESSCDETAAAVLDDGGLKSSVIASQVELHAPFGGVVPELASREHLRVVDHLVHEACRQARCSAGELDLIAATSAPGLVGALLIGAQMARGVALALERPVVGVHHLEGHLFSVGLEHGPQAYELRPHLALLVSGGHSEFVDVRGLGSYRRLGGTRDDAVGEAYDKVAKLLGIGYPGGPVIDRLAAEGDPQKHTFPRAMINSGDLDLSFAGLKTAVRVQVDRDGPPRSFQDLCDLCASFQAAVVEVMIHKTAAALESSGAKRLHLVGGVAANRALRAGMRELCEHKDVTLAAAPLRFCGDNAAMIGAAAFARAQRGRFEAVHVRSSHSLEALCP